MWFNYFICVYDKTQVKPRSSQLVWQIVGLTKLHLMPAFFFLKALPVLLSIPETAKSALLLFLHAVKHKTELVRQNLAKNLNFCSCLSPKDPDFVSLYSVLFQTGLPRSWIWIVIWSGIWTPPPRSFVQPQATPCPATTALNCESWTPLCSRYHSCQYKVQ